MWSDRIIVFGPFLDDYLSFLEGVEHFPVEKFISEPGIEAFAIAFPPTARRDSDDLPRIPASQNPEMAPLRVL